MDYISQIKPIETVYKGYRFRSRLEARWAVFFDAFNIKWDYEIEGYDINGIWYLPDFWLQDFNCFIEIKPFIGTNELYQNFRDVTNISIIHIGGSPWEYSAIWFGYDSCDSGAGCYDDECVIMSPMAIVVKCERKDRTLFVSEWNTNDNIIESHAYNVGKYPWDWNECKKYSEFNARDAIAKSKRARFEHGESP